MAASRAVWALIGVAAVAAGYFALQNPAHSPEHISETAPSLLWGFSAEPSASAAALRPLPSTIELDERKVQLGKRLFHDPRLSREGSVACASCHDIGMGGADGLATSIGLDGARTAVNAPTVLNSGFNAAQFWDGRASTLEEQIDGPLSHPDEMGTSWEEVIAKLEAEAAYVEAFAELYPGGIGPDAVKDAIAAYERSLITPNAPFDRYLRGEEDAISERARAGYRLFTSYGCVSCHQGINIGGNLFEKFGVVVPRHKHVGYFKPADLGRYNVTGRDGDRFVFKVPSLRNVTLTAPYFHDGSAETLAEAIRQMGLHQLGRELSDEEVALLAEFLATLTGEIPGD